MGRVIVAARTAEPPAALRGAIERGRIAGLLWFRSALAPSGAGGSVAEARETIARTRSLWPAGARAIFAADEEGGLIQQLDGLRDEDGTIWPRLPSARALGRAGDPAASFAHGREIGRRMRRLGLDVALAPVVDLDPGAGSGVLGTRCFGSDPDAVAAHALAWLRGLASAGVHGCLKHYPGHGRTRLDSHLDLPRIDEAEDDEAHLRPFERIAREWDDAEGPPPSVLSAHLLPAHGTLPISLDPDALARIPRRLGPVWTDSLDMGALARYGSIAERGALALAAGSDLLVVGVDLPGGLALADALADSLDPADRPRTAGVLEAIEAMPARSIPEPWPRESIEAVAARALAVYPAAGPSLPTGEWDWLLPDRVGLYGAVASPPPSTSPAAGRREIREVRRYPAGDPAALRAALAGSAAGERPVLFGWVHRGREDAETAAILTQHAGHPIAAVAHLLDGPGDPQAPSRLWQAETCGFGEAEIAMLAAVWRRA